MADIWLHRKIIGEKMALWGILHLFWEGGIPFMIEFFIANLMWVFIFATLAYYVVRKDLLILGIPIMAVYLWASVQWADAMGFVLLVGGFLSISYIIRIAVIGFAESVPALKSRVPLMLFLSFIVILFFYNIFMR
ncbi:MAG: hypothetical protein ABID38_06310 [Candidatus Diapherotrites archaeon]